MANLLYRLGRLAARRAWIVLVGWIVVLGLAGGAYAAFGGTLASSFSIPGTETERVSDELAAAMPDLAGATATVVFTTDGDAFTEAQESAIADLLDEVDAVDGVAATSNPFDTDAERDEQAQQLADAQAQIDAAQAQIDAGQQQLDAAIAQAQAAGAYDAAKAQFDAQQATIDEGQAALDAQAQQVADGQTLLDAASEIQTVSDDGTAAVGTIAFTEDQYSLSSDLKTQIAAMLDDAGIDGVQVTYSATIAESIDGLIGVGEIVGVIIAALVLVVMLRAFLPAVTPLITSLIGVGVGVAGAMAFSGVVDMASVTPVLGLMLGLAVGIDYALFILNRHRRQLLAGMAVPESIGLANGTSGNAVVFAGTTVIVALLALNVTGIPFLGVMGTVGAICVAIAVLVAITLTPALLGIMKLRVLGRRARTRIGHPDHAPYTPKPMRTGRAMLQAGIAVVALLVIAIPALSMRLGLPDGSSASTDSTQYKAYTTVAEKFGAGMNGTLLVVATFPEAVADDDQTSTEADIVTTLMAQDGVVAAAPVAVSDDGTIFAFQVVPAEGPSSESTEQLVYDLRGLSPLDGDVQLGVAGTTTANIDVSAKIADALPVYLVVVIGLSLLIMILVFRSILVPVIATAGYVLSLFAALGSVTAIYQWGWLSAIFGVHDPGPVLSFAPIIIMGVLFGLAMDYQLFLVSGMREAYAHGMKARSAVVAGLRNGRAVVTAAAIIMVSVFGGFVFSEMSMIRPLGFGMAIGVLFDAFVVRMVLTPALLHLFGNAAWWLPRWLDRILPDVDVEGAALERTHPLHVG
ncbi:MAG: MMPL family transporter [Microbacterium sp.]|uniref:MMPL family transporter n=1 Tax=Microbacterium sp. TaxID=51671 RepID=UPI0039E5A3CC